jgi:alpha-galactosidase
MSKIITVIGAASITFGPKILRDIINHPELDGCTFRFVDINEAHLAIYKRLAQRVAETINHTITIEADTDRKKMLPGSDFVIGSVEINHYEFWEKDFTIPRNLGSRQINGELGGPGGMFHAFRQIPVHLEIAKDIAELCPKAMVMIVSNPLNRICLALERHSKVGQVVGLCHGVEMAEKLILNNILDIDGYDIEAFAAGTNHMSWILQLRHKKTGQDLYPLLKEKLKTYDQTYYPLSRKLFEIYGYYNGVGDSHVGEYLPFAAEFGDASTERFQHYKTNDKGRWDYLAKVASGEIALDTNPSYTTIDDACITNQFFTPRSWIDTLSIPIIAAMQAHRFHKMPALNLVNTGQIANLPRGVFVETPAAIDAHGVQALNVGELPKPLAAFCQRDIEQTELMVEAAVKGERNLALQAMLLDPITDSISTAEKVLDAMLLEFKDYLPQFA